MISLSKKPLRVLMVTGVYPTAETPHLGTFIKSQTESLVKAGLEVELIHPKPGRPLPLRFASAALQVFFKTLTGKFDIVHGHYGHWCLAARLQWTTPVVASFLGDDLLGFPLGDGRYSKKHALIVHLSRWLCGVVDAVIVKTEEMKKASRRDEVFIIPNGVDFKLFQPIPRAEARTELGWDQNRYYVLFAHNPFEVRKRFPLAQEAIEHLRNRGINAELVVAHGISQEQIVKYINACNAVILPSIHEGSPNIVKETMACNVPVVSTFVGDVLHVTSKTKGCKVCADDPEALAAGLEEALQFRGPTTGRADMGHLECSIVAKQVIAVYEQAISRKAQKHPLSRNGHAIVR